MPSHRIEHKDGTCHVILLGDFTAAIVQELRNALVPLIESGTRTVEFNLAATPMMDSSGIGLLIVTGNSLARVQGTLRVSNVSPDIFRMLQSMRLAERLHATVRQP